MKIKDIQESTVAGSIASVAKPLGELQTRSKPEKAPKVTKGKKYANTISESIYKKIRDHLTDMDDDEFQRVYKNTKAFWASKLLTPPAPRTNTPSSKTGSKVWHDTGYTDKNAAARAKEKPIQEDELKEEDLIILPGMLKGKDKSFISKEHDRRDHEVEMARSDVYAAAKDAMRIFKILENRTEDDGLMGWQQSYITLASDYLNSVADSLEYDSISNEGAASAIITKLAQKGAKNLPKTPETQRAVANRAMELEKNFNRVAAAGAAGAGAAAGKAVYDKKTNEGAGVIAGGMSNAEESKVNELKRATINNYISQSSAALRGGRKEVPKPVPSWKVAAGKVNPDSVMGKYAKVKAGDLQDVKEEKIGGMPYDRLQGLQDPRGHKPLGQNFAGSQGKEILKVGTVVRVPYKGKMVLGKIVRYDPGKGGESPAYVVDIGESESKIVPVHDVKQGVAEEQPPMFTPEEEQLDEKKDACYSKVKSRYKVWPSAYASGALVKCRKVGASNWGNKSKK